MTDLFNSHDDDSIDVYEFQIRRMRAMRGYPKGEDDEWVIIARKYSPSILDLCDCVSQLIEECLSFPSCAELKSALVARRPQERKTYEPIPPEDPVALNKFFAENEAIMARARQKEIDNKAKNVRVREFLKIRDFMDVDFPQRWWAEIQLGYDIDPVCRKDAEEWFRNLAPGQDPRVVVKLRRGSLVLNL